MKLAKYLADYLASEDVLLESYAPETGEIELIIQQGIEAFASTEDASIDIYHWKYDDEGMPKIAYKEGYNK